MRAPYGTEADRRITIPGLTERQCSTLVRDGDCIVATECLNSKTGYASVWRDGRVQYLHRIVAEAVHGPAPFPRAVVHHSCEVPACCNPAHLEWTTHRENVLLGSGPSAINARKTHCAEGHPLVAVPGKKPQRRCLICRKAYKAEWDRKRRERAA